MYKSVKAVLLIVCLCGTAVAQNPFPDYAFLLGNYDGAALQLEVKIGYGFSLDPGNSVGFDLYRMTLATTECTQYVRITDHPISWPSSLPATVNLTDAAVTPHTAYRYKIAPVDAQRNPANLIETGGEATTGVALLTHGPIYADPYGSPSGYWCGPLCPLECVGDGRLLLPVALLDYLDTGTSLLLYGEVVGVSFGANVYFSTFPIDHGVPTSCIVAVAPTTWSTVKHIYR